MGMVNEQCSRCQRYLKSCPRPCHRLDNEEHNCPDYELNVKRKKDSSHSVCPECGWCVIETFVDKIDFGQIEVIYVPVRQCMKCSFAWTDYVAEEIYNKHMEEIKKIKEDEREPLKIILRNLTAGAVNPMWIEDYIKKIQKNWNK